MLEGLIIVCTVFVPSSWLNPFRVDTEYLLARSEAQCAHYANKVLKVNFYNAWQYKLPRDREEVERKCGKDLQDCKPLPE